MQQRGKFARLHDAKFGTILGGFRLLICERLGWQPLGFAMSSSSFLAVEKEFKLPTEALSILHDNGGRHAIHFGVSSHDDPSHESLGGRLKAVLVGSGC